MEGLRTKILAEGEEEAHTYDKMACFCKDTTAEKQAAIEDGENKKEELRSRLLSGPRCVTSSTRRSSRCSRRSRPP